MADTLADESFVLMKCDYFVDVHLWPTRTVVDPRGWLDNFEPDERPYAVQLLNAFQFFSAELTDALFVGAFNDLSRLIAAPDSATETANAKWRSFAESVIVTYPTGETASVTDSGHIFARKARLTLGIAEHQILDPETALRRLASAPERGVVFVDDFVGSGNQFLTSWNRRHSVLGQRLSFADLMEERGFPAYFVPIMAAQLGLGAIQSRAPSVKVVPAHELPKSYGALDPNSVVWPAAERLNGVRVIESASARAGIPDYDGSRPKDWRGFAKLGLCTAFEHGVPDVTLPLFSWSGGDWKPLVNL